MIINVNGELLPPEQATINVLDHGFLFGDSIYEVVRTVGNRLFTADEHLARLERSAERILLPLPLSRDEFTAELTRTHSAFGGGHAYLRLIVTRGVGELDLHPASCSNPTWLIIAKPLPDWGGKKTWEDGVSIVFVNVRRNSREALDPAIKSGNYLNNVMALIEARKSGASEGIMCNAQGFVTEGTTSNIFCVRGGVICTPAVNIGILPGITRELVVRLARELEYEIVEGNLRAADFATAEEVFLTSTTRGVMPVTQIDGQPVESGRPGPITQALIGAYDDLLASAR